MQKIIVSFIMMCFSTSGFLLASADFEVDPQTRAKISLKGAVAKDFVVISAGSFDTGPAKSLSAGGALSAEYPIVPWLNLSGNNIVT